MWKVISTPPHRSFKEGDRTCTWISQMKKQLWKQSLPPTFPTKQPCLLSPPNNSSLVPFRRILLIKTEDLGEDRTKLNIIKPTHSGHIKLAKGRAVSQDFTRTLQVNMFQSLARGIRTEFQGRWRNKNLPPAPADCTTGLRLTWCLKKTS